MLIFSGFLSEQSSKRERCSINFVAEKFPLDYSKKESCAVVKDKDFIPVQHEYIFTFIKFFY